MKVLPEPLQVARYSLTRSHNYVSAMLLSLNFIEEKRVPTIGVDKWWRCYYNPDWLFKHPTKEIQGLLFHEINHLLRSHPERSEFFEDKHRMNVAEDIELNPDVLSSGLELPASRLMPDQFGLPDGLLAEEIFHKLPPSPQLFGGKGSQAVAGKPGTGNGECGSCAGNPIDGEADAPAPSDGIGHAEQELIKRQVAKDVESAAKSQGNVPAGLKRWADMTLHPQVKWTKELASQVRRAMIEVMGKQDRTFKRPSRVSSALGGMIVLPGWKSYLPNVAMVFDTSGSMGETDLAKSVAEGKGVLRAVGSAGFGVTTISVDCSVGSKQRVQRMSAVQLSGGGGTDMRIGLTEAEGIKPKVDIVIVFTDGDTPWPNEPAPFKTIVILTSGDRAVPDWAKKIVVN